MTVTKDQAQMLVSLTTDARRHTNGPRWDTAGIVAAVDRISHWSLAGAMVELGLAAADANAETPGVIGTNGPHRRVAIPTPPVAPRSAPTGTRCTACGNPSHSGGEDHEFRHPSPRDPDAWAAHVAELRGEVVATSGPSEPRSLEDMREANPVFAARLDRVRAALPSGPLREPDHPESAAVGVAVSDDAGRLG